MDINSLAASLIEQDDARKAAAPLPIQHVVEVALTVDDGNGDQETVLTEFVNGQGLDPINPSHVALANFIDRASQESPLTAQRRAELLTELEIPDSPGVLARMLRALPDRAKVDHCAGCPRVEICIDDAAPGNAQGGSVQVPTDDALSVEATFTYKSPRAPLCAECRVFEQEVFTGRIPYKLAGADMTEWVPVEQVEFTATSTCPCGGFTTWKIVAKNEGGQLDVTFEREEKDRLSKVTKNLGALSHMPNYR